MIECLEGSDFSLEPLERTPVVRLPQIEHLHRDALVRTAIYGDERTALPAASERLHDLIAVQRVVSSHRRRKSAGADRLGQAGRQIRRDAAVVLPPRRLRTPVCPPPWTGLAAASRQ